MALSKMYECVCVCVHGTINDIEMAIAVSKSMDDEGLLKDT